jgi:tripartite-type tricarboxylate transporter receptor subunit TctC
VIKTICILTMALCAQVGTAFARDIEAPAFFKGKQISLFIGAAPGGGYDTYARLLGRYLPKYIPGNPTIVPVNMPGVGGAIVVSHLRSEAPRDGTAIGALQAGLITASLFAPKKGYNTRDLTFLGSANSEDDLCWMRSDASVKSYTDVFEKQLIIGAASPGDSTYDLPTAENNMLGTRYKLVPGYTGAAEILLALDRDEVQGICGTGPPAMMAQKAAWVNSGYLKPLVQENDVGIPRLNEQGLPRAASFAKTAEDRKALGLIYLPQKFGRPFVMPPGVPADRTEVLRHAFVQTLADKDLLAEAKKMNLDIVAMSGADMGKLVNNAFNTAPQIIARAKQALSSSAFK